MAKSEVPTKVEEIITPYLKDNGLCVYKIDYRKAGREWKLDIFIDKEGGKATDYVGIDECEGVSKYLSDALDDLDIIDHSYTLSVSSAGLDREILTDRDYERFQGRKVEVRLYESIKNRKFLVGTLKGLNEGIVTIELEDDIGCEIRIPQSKISKINLEVAF